MIFNPLKKRVGETMTTSVYGARSAFTLVEIMIVVAIMGVLTTLAIPSFMKARKQVFGRRIINDARQLDAAIDQWALENGKKNGDAVDTMSAAKYLRMSWPTADVLGNNYVLNTVGPTQIQIAAETKMALDNVGIDWGWY